MPIYDARLNDTGPLSQAGHAPFGREPFPRFEGKPGRLVDATGRAVSGYLLACDTEVGWVDRYARDAAGGFLLGPDFRVATERLHLPAPLTYLPPEECDEPIVVTAPPGRS